MRLPTLLGFVLASAVAYACGGSTTEFPVEGSGADVKSAPAMAMDDGTEPPLFKVDAGRTMNVAPGEGIGVFVEYAEGGKWHLFWSCDGAVTSNACEVDLSLVADDGALTAVTAEGFSSGDVVDTTTTAGALRATSTITRESKGVRFTTTPGGVITVGARVRGLQLPEFFFLVENTAVKGGAATSFTNPVKLVGSKP